MKNLLKLILTVLILIPLSCDSESSLESTAPDAATINDDDVLNAKSTSKQTVAIFDVVNGVAAGSSTLHRNRNGITMNFKATGLIAGHAYTVWLVIWNNPEFCLVPGECGEDDFVDNPNFGMIGVELLYAAGHVAGNNGKGNFSGHLNENDASGTINHLFGWPSYGGLLDAEKAEVHGVLRSHGPKVPGIVNEQIGSYLGGCPSTPPYGFLPFSEIPDEVGECGDIYASVHRL